MRKSKKPIHYAEVIGLPKHDPERVPKTADAKGLNAVTLELTEHELRAALDRYWAAHGPDTGRGVRP